MATAGFQSSLTCTVCLEVFKEPKVLPCCHTFCKSCLDRVLEGSSTKETLSCPQCRGEHAVPANGTEGFLTDYTIASELVTSDLKSKEQKPSCGECDSDDPAVAYCRECESYLCEYCSGGHKRMKRFRDHNPLPLNSITPDVLKSSRGDVHCCDHPDKPLVAFCDNCQVLVCGDCIVTSNHVRHTYSAIDSSTRQEFVRNQKAQLERAKAKLTALKEDLEYIKMVKQKLVNTPDQLKMAINGTFNSLVATLEARRAQLLKEAEDKCTGDLKKVWSQKEVVETAVVGLETSVGFTERVLQCSSDAEVLSLGPQASSRLRELEGTEWDAEMVEELEESKHEFLGGNHAAYLRGIGQLQVTKVPAPIVIEGVQKSLPLGKKAEFMVANKGRRKLKIPRPSVTVSYGCSKSKDRLTPVMKADGKWVISFTPVCGGQHSLSVSVQGREVEGNPYEFTVHGKPMAGDHVTMGPDWCYGDLGTYGTVEASPDGDRLVVEWDNGKRYRFKWGTASREYACCQVGCIVGYTSLGVKPRPSKVNFILVDCTCATTFTTVYCVLVFKSLK